MNLNFGSRAVVITALMLCAAGSVSAQSALTNTGFYVGASAGAAKYPGNPTVVLGSFTLHSTDTNRDDMSWAVTGGYRFSKHFAIEGGYMDLGEGTAHLVDSAGSDLQSDLTFSVRGETVAAVVMFPTWKWETFLKVGVLFQDVNLHINGTQSGVPFALSSSADGGKLYWEGGVSYHFDEKWSARVGLTSFSDLGDKDRTGRADIRSSFLGVSYQF